MRSVNILPADTYIVTNKMLLNDENRKAILILYQPIIGSKATGLYFTLWSDLDKAEVVSGEWTHHHLLSRTGLNIDEIIEAREKLEALGLLKTYVKKGNVNSYIYELYSPLSPFEFLNDPVLSTALYNHVGKLEYERIIGVFTIPKIDLSEYQDITVGFKDVYEISYDMPYNFNEKNIKHNTYRELSLKSEIDLDNVLTLIPEDILNPGSITKEIKDLIYKLSFIYNFKEDELRQIIINSINDKKVIDKESLKGNCRQFYKFENYGKLPSIVYKNQPEYLRKNIVKDTNKNKMIYIFENFSPANFLLAKSKGSSLSNTEKEILVYLLVDLNLNPGVVNVLLDYVLRINNNKLVKKFVETIALQWKRSNINTVEDAMKLAEEEYKARKKVFERKGKKDSKIINEKPSWMDSEITDSEEDDSVKQELEELLKEYK